MTWLVDKASTGRMVFLDNFGHASPGRNIFRNRANRATRKRKKANGRYRKHGR